MRSLFYINNQLLDLGPTKIDTKTEDNGMFKTNRGTPIIIATNYIKNNLIANRLETWSWSVVNHNSNLFNTLNNIIKSKNVLNILIKYVKIVNGHLDYDIVQYQAILKNYNIAINQFMFKDGLVSYQYELVLRCF